MLNFRKVGIVAVLAAPLSAFAAGPDLTALSGAVDFTTVIAAILAVAGSAIGAVLTWKGVQMVYHAVKGS